MDQSDTWGINKSRICQKRDQGGSQELLALRSLTDTTHDQAQCQQSTLGLNISGGKAI